MDIKMPVKKFVFIVLLLFVIGGLFYWVYDNYDVVKDFIPSWMRSKQELTEKSSQKLTFPSVPSSPTVSTVNTIRGPEKVEYNSDEVGGKVQDFTGNLITIDGMQLLLNPEAEISIVKGKNSMSREQIAKKKSVGKRKDIRVGDDVRGVFVNERRTEGIFFLIIFRP